MKILENIVKWSEKVDAIFKEKGISLFEIFEQNWAFTKENALDVIDKLKEKQIPILGGDVLIKRKNIIYHTYDNWCCEIRDMPVGETFLNFSIEKSRQYILNYPSTTKEKEVILFTIVPKVKNDDKNNIEIIRLVRW
jgi:hypothetical protein